MKDALPEYVRQTGEGEWRMRVWVQPGAKKDELAGLHQGHLKIRLGAPAVDNKANQALLAFVAKLLGLRRSQVSLEAGQTSRQKTLCVRTMAAPVWPEPTDHAVSQTPTEGDGEDYGSKRTRPHRKVRDSGH
jgi:uncharacterized protein (TIGR00251 family)